MPNNSKCCLGAIHREVSCSFFVSIRNKIIVLVIQRRVFYKTDVINKDGRVKSLAILFCVRPAWAYSNGCKSLTQPNSGKRPANDKGVHREV